MTKSRNIGRGGHNKINIDLDNLEERYLNNEPVQNIANEYGVSVQTIYHRLKKLGITKSNSESHIGQQAWNKGKQNQDIKGYRSITVDNIQIREHRHVMEQYLERKLEKGEVVHHINGNITDNRIENLELFHSHAQHMKEHSDRETMRKRGIKGAKARWL